MDFIKDLTGFLMQRKKFWLFPAILLIGLLGLLMLVSAGTAIAPIIYTLF